MPFCATTSTRANWLKATRCPASGSTPWYRISRCAILKSTWAPTCSTFWGAHKYPNFNYSGLAGWQGNSTQNGFHAVPIFRVQMQLAHNLNVLVGTLHGKSNHGPITPLYNDELNLSADPETGVQVLWHTRPFTLDALGKLGKFYFSQRQRTGILQFRPQHALPSLA